MPSVFTWWDLAVLTVSFIAGALAAVTGFGIGSLLTPIFSLLVDTRLAVAAISVPHVVGTALRFWLLNSAVNRKVFWNFGLTSAAGGLAGALLQYGVSNRWLTFVFGALLLFAAYSQATGLARRMRFRGHVAWIAGALSGLLGGLVGNQGGLRSAALLGFDLSRKEFVATATAVALVVDGVRMPVYIATQFRALLDIAPTIVVAAIGVVFGTWLGNGILSRIPDAWFERVLAVILALLGLAMLVRASG